MLRYFVEKLIKCKVFKTGSKIFIQPKRVRPRRLTD